MHHISMREIGGDKVSVGVEGGWDGAFGGSTSDGVFKVCVGSRDGKSGEEMAGRW